MFNNGDNSSSGNVRRNTIQISGSSPSLPKGTNPSALMAATTKMKQK